MGTEKNAEQRSIDEKKRLERERWEREERERERREAEEEWEVERRRAGDWERAKAAILAGKAEIRDSWSSYGPCTGIEPSGGDFTVSLKKRTCRLRLTAWEWKKPLWDKTMPLSEEEVERLRTTCAAIVLPQRKRKPRGLAQCCDGGTWGWCVRLGTKTLFSRHTDTLRYPCGDEQWDAEEKAETEALEPLRDMLYDFQEKCEPAEGELEKIVEERRTKEREREEAARRAEEAEGDGPEEGR